LATFIEFRFWKMALQQLVQEYMEMPPITRAYTTACVFTTVAVQLDIVTPFQLYFNPMLIFRSYQLWRLITSFCFFGGFGFSFLFNMIFTYRYCRMLEEGSFRGRTADFFIMFLFGGTIMVMMAVFVNMVFLGQAFTIMLVYVWSRRNPYIRMNFFRPSHIPSAFFALGASGVFLIAGECGDRRFYGNRLRPFLLFFGRRLSVAKGRISSSQNARFYKTHIRRWSGSRSKLSAATRRTTRRFQLGRRSSRSTTTGTTAPAEARRRTMRDRIEIDILSYVL